MTRIVRLQVKRRRRIDPQTKEPVSEQVQYEVTIPKAIGEAMGWTKGTDLEITIDAERGRPVVLLKESK